MWGTAGGICGATAVSNKSPKDQSLVAKLVEEGAITEEEAHFHPRRNVILYSLGSERSPKIDLFEQPLQTGDILFLCSDGLTRHVADEEIAYVLSQETMDTACTNLIQKANERGGEDNISVAIIRFDGQATAVARPGTQPTTPRAAARNGTGTQQVANRSALWLYTVMLGMVQALLIFLVWFLLRV